MPRCSWPNRPIKAGGYIVTPVFTLTSTPFGDTAASLTERWNLQRHPRISQNQVVAAADLVWYNVWRYKEMKG